MIKAGIKECRNESPMATNDLLGLMLDQQVRPFCGYLIEIHRPRADERWLNQ
jgi:hypothetical protein